VPPSPGCLATTATAVNTNTHAEAAQWDMTRDGWHRRLWFESSPCAAITTVNVGIAVVVIISLENNFGVSLNANASDLVMCPRLSASVLKICRTDFSFTG
jgi:hypothetical protein